MKCNWEGCTDHAVRGRLHLCAKHRDENYLQKVKDANDRGTEKKRKWRETNPVLCRVPGCNNPASTPKSHRCQACKDKLRADRWILYPKDKAMDANLGPREPPKPKPRQVVTPIMTDAEQERINRDVQRKSDTMRAAVNQDMLAQRLLKGAIVPAYGTGYGTDTRTEYTPPKKVLVYASNHACSWD